MRTITIIPAERFMRVDGETIFFPPGVPWPERDDYKRPTLVVGTDTAKKCYVRERASLIAGLRDIEHVTDEELAPYQEAWDLEKARLAEVKRAAEEEATRLAEESERRNAELAAAERSDPAPTGG
jgi:hypothetical protein